MWSKVVGRLTKAPGETRTAARKRFFNKARPMTPYLSVETKGLTFFVSTSDRLGRGLFARRWREDFGQLERAVALLSDRGFFRAGSTFVDVGANIGTTTVAAIRRHGFARAVALEPGPENFRTLRLNLVANDVEPYVTALELAAADREGEVELLLSPRSGGEHTILPDGKRGKTRVVPAVQLDDLVRRGTIAPDSVGLLWIDAAGAEGLVLAGASTLRERGVPIVTAIRPALASWPETKKTLIRLLDGYTDFANLRRGSEAPVADLAQLLGSLGANADLLAFRR